VVALADPDKDGRSQRAAEAGAEHTYKDYRRMLERERPDFVSIGPRWTIRHKEYLEACAAVGAHGIMEKPLAVDLVEADKMIRLVDDRGLKWSMAFNYRASPVIDHARRMIMEEGLIGDVLEIRSRGKEDTRAGGEDLIVLGVHSFDMMVSFLGPPGWCSSSITVEGRPAVPADVGDATEPLGPVVGDRIQATFGFRDGINGYFTSQKNRHGNGGRWGTDIFGSKGIVTIRMTTVPEVFWLNEPSWAPGVGKCNWKILPGSPVLKAGGSKVWHYAPIVMDLVEAVEQDRRPLVSLHDGRMALEMIQAINESYVQGGVPVDIPLKRRKHPLKSWS
jgi:predicted dehydrogenase